MDMTQRRSCEAGADRPVQQMSDLTSLRQPMAHSSAHSGVATLFIKYRSLALIRKGALMAG